MFSGISIGFKPSAPIFTYLNNYVSSGKEQAIYFSFDYSQGLWDSDRYLAFSKQGNSNYAYTDAPDNFSVGNMPSSWVVDPTKPNSPEQNPGKFHPIVDSKGFWTLPKISFEFNSPDLPSIKDSEICFTDGVESFVSFGTSEDSKKLDDKIYKEACGGTTFDDCKKSFDPTKLPTMTLTIDGVKQTIESKDYIVYKWKDGKPESKAISDLWVGYSSRGMVKNDQCPESAKIVIGRLFLARFRTTFRAGADASRHIAIESFGESQFKMDGGIGFFWWLVIILLVGGAIGAGVYFFVIKKKGAKIT